jgi:membrane AbrB-like protein
MWLLILALTLCIGTLGGFLISRLRVPGGFMVGALCAVALFNILSRGFTGVPAQSKFLVQIIAASFIGLSIGKEDLARLPGLFKPMFIMASGFLILNITAGFLMYIAGPMDPVTSFMSAIPGGVNETPIIAADMGADAPKVAVMQIFRLIAGIGVFPSLALIYGKGGRTGAPGNGAVPVFPGLSGEKSRKKAVPSPEGDKKQAERGRRGLAFAATLGLGCAACYLGWLTGLPGMPFVFPILSALILNLGFAFAYLPQGLRKIAQVLSGCYLGSSLSVEDVLEMRFLALPLGILIAGYMLNGLITGKILEKRCGFTRAESLLITIPAGASDMALIAADMGIVNADISLLQVTRLLLVMAVFPQVINLILLLF